MRKEWFEQKEKMIREEWFKSHKATLSDTEQVLRWKRPESSGYMVDYVKYGSVLFVTGDLGSAVYRWGQILTWEFLASLDRDYFLGKLEASESGRTGQVWDDHEAQQELAAWYLQAKGKSLQRRIEAGTHSEYVRWLMENPRLFDGRLDDCAEFGLVPNVRMISHWAGIKMAMAQMPQKFKPEETCQK